MLTRFHDENIISIELVDGGLSLALTLNGAVANVYITCLKKLRVDRFQEGNIVNSVFVYSGEECLGHEESIRTALRYLYDIDAQSIKNKPSLTPFLEQQFKKIINGELILVEVEPSYGCYIVALGEKFRINRARLD